jgi:sigma-B regulation protein RsbU (phosphoserine phosphatase)
MNLNAGCLSPISTAKIFWQISLCRDSDSERALPMQCSLVCTLELSSLRESFERLMRLALLDSRRHACWRRRALSCFIYRVIIRRLYESLESASQKLAARRFFRRIQRSQYALTKLIIWLETFYANERLRLPKRRSVLEETLLSLEKVNFDLEGDLILGEEVQRSILPELRTAENIEWAVTYRPVGRVSGDFYDVFELPAGATGILQFDASGHGVPAALLTMMAKISFAEAVRKYASPAQVVSHVNDELSSHLQKTGNFLTAFYGVIDMNGKLVYCNAAHTQAILLKANGASQLLDPTSLSIGFAPVGGSAFHSAEMQLAPRRPPGALYRRSYRDT